MGIICSIRFPLLIPLSHYAKHSMEYFSIPTIRNYWCSRGGVTNGKITDLNVQHADHGLTDTGAATSVSATLTFSPQAAHTANSQSKEIENFKTLTVVTFNSFLVDADTTGGTANCSVNGIALSSIFSLFSNTIPATGYGQALYASVFTANVEGLKLANVAVTMTMPAASTTGSPVANDVKAQEVFVLPGTWSVVSSNTTGGTLPSIANNDVIFASSRSAASASTTGANTYPTFSGTGIRVLLLNRMTNSAGGTNNGGIGQAFTSMHYVIGNGTFVMTAPNFSVTTGAGTPSSPSTVTSVPYNQSVILLRKTGV